LRRLGIVESSDRFPDLAPSAAWLAGVEQPPRHRAQGDRCTPQNFEHWTATHRFLTAAALLP
jgi:hypothetical protein